MPDKIHHRIKNRRQELGLSQESLATACNVRQSSVANWERGGHVPRAGKINIIAKALDIEEVWLVSGEHPTNEGPVNSYLNTPIRHIPVHNWPPSQSDFETQKPIGYVTMTIEPENVFALLAPEDGTPFKKDTLLMFCKDYKSSEAGVFLETSNSQLALNSADKAGENCIGRLIYSQSAH